MRQPFVYGVENLAAALAAFPPGEKHVEVHPGVAFPPGWHGDAPGLHPPGVPPCPEHCHLAPCHPRVCHLRGVWLPPVAEALAADTSVTVLDLSASDADEQPPLAHLLRANRTLRTLVLSMNRLGDEGVAILAEGLAANTALTRLDLHDNGVGAAGWAALQRAIDARGTPLELRA
jgi:hypothetical protein